MEVCFIPYIKPSSTLRNQYNEISDFCHKNHEPVFITRNGAGDLAVLSIEAYEQLVGKFELYKLINEGLEDVEASRVIPVDVFFEKLESEFHDENL